MLSRLAATTPRTSLLARPPPAAAVLVPHLSRRHLSAAPAPAPQAKLVRADGGLTFLELDRPQAKNALSVALVDSLRQLVEEVRFDGSVLAACRPSRLVVLAPRTRES